MLRFDVVTIFPKMFEPVLNESIIKRAKMKKKVNIALHDMRDFTPDKHRKVDDRPFGGGPGMVMRPEPIFNTIAHIKKKAARKKSKVILLSPAGKRLSQPLAKKLAKEKHLILICGHYEGVDERVKNLVTEEISVGDYVLTGGELPAMVLIDAVVRLVPGVLGHSDSTVDESFENSLLEYPHYTRPAMYKGLKVPEILLCGDPKKIEDWRRKEAIKRTKKVRPDLLVASKDKK
ncbi:tRNA (guanosine(37)-N1)-methyltransferase TrmD [Candidatus Omnitrophota bacterium]